MFDDKPDADELRLRAVNTAIFTRPGVEPCYICKGSGRCACAACAKKNNGMCGACGGTGIEDTSVPF